MANGPFSGLGFARKIGQIHAFRVSTHICARKIGQIHSREPGRSRKTRPGTAKKVRVKGSARQSLCVEADCWIWLCFAARRDRKISRRRGAGRSVRPGARSAPSSGKISLSRRATQNRARSNKEPPRTNGGAAKNARSFALSLFRFLDSFCGIWTVGIGFFARWWARGKKLSTRH